MPDPAERPLEFTTLGRAWCASSLPLMVLIVACLMAAEGERFLSFLLWIALVATPCGLALALARCRRLARAGPFGRSDVRRRFLAVGAILGVVIPTAVVASAALFGVVASLEKPFELLSLLVAVFLYACVGSAIGLIIALPLAWLAGWIASRTGFRPAVP